MHWYYIVIYCWIAGWADYWLGGKPYLRYWVISMAFGWFSVPARILARLANG